MSFCIPKNRFLEHLDCIFVKDAVMNGILSEHVDVDVLSEAADNLHLLSGHSSSLSANNLSNLSHFLWSIKLSHEDLIVLVHVDNRAS